MMMVTAIKAMKIIAIVQVHNMKQRQINEGSKMVNRRRMI